jgi:hypothetical protein
LYVFEFCGKHVASKRFAADANMKQAVTAWQLTPVFFYAAIQGLVSLYSKCLNVFGECGESGVHHLLLICYVYM